MSENEKKYDAFLVDTSIYDQYGLRLEKGLLGKLSQFRKSPINFLLPDVIKNEVRSHLEQKIKVSKNALEKSLNDAADHLFFPGSTLNDAKKCLTESKEVKELAEHRLNEFIKETGALFLETGNFVSVASLLEKYFSNSPPFAETGKKKSEFPDAIVLMAVDVWAESENKQVLAVANDGDWEKYCQTSKHVHYINDFSSALSSFNQANGPYALLVNLEQSFQNQTASNFLEKISEGLNNALDGITPDQDAESYHYWEPEGCHAWFKEFHLIENEFRIIETDEDWVVLETKAEIIVGAEGDFSLSVYDSIDKDYVSLGSVSVEAEDKFESEILIKISGDLNGPIDKLYIEEVEVVDPIGTIDFGTIEPDYGDDEYYYSHEET
jgi:hypothetical protein